MALFNTYALNGPCVVETALICMPASLLNKIFAFCSLNGLLSLSRCSFALYNIFNNYKRSAWNLDTFFARWFNRPREFRRILECGGSIISGSQALQFFDRTYYRDSDMDIFVRKEGVLLTAHFLESSGYHVQCKRKEDEIYEILTASEGNPILDAFRSKKGFITAILDYVRIDCDNGIQSSRCVQLLVVNVNPIRFVLFDFHSSEPPYTSSPKFN